MAKLLNVNQARQLGYTDEEIRNYLMSNPGVGIQAEPAISTTQKTQGGQSSALANLLPIVGGIAGGALGTPFGPAGLIAGSAIGSGLGELGRQSITGGGYNVGKIAGETALGGVGGGLGVLLGGAVKGGRFLRAAGGMADEATDVGRVAKLGTTLETSGTKMAGIKALKGRNVATRATDIAKTSAKLPGLTSGAKLDVIPKQRAALTEALNALTNSENAVATKVGGKTLLAKAQLQAGGAVDLSTGIGKTNWNFWAPKIAKIKNAQQLGQTNRDLLIAIEKAPPAQKTVLRAIQRTLGDELKTKIVGVDELMGSLSKLNAAEPVIQKEAGTELRTIFGMNVKRPVQGMTNLTGKALEATGGGLSRVGSIPRLAAGQAVPRALGFGGGEAAGEYTPLPTETAATEAYNQPLQPTMKITAEQVALARLMLPDKQADAIEAAYNVLNKGKTASASEEFLNKAADNIAMLQETETLGYGPIQGNIYETQLKYAGGAGAPAKAVALNQRYNLLKLNILRAYQGARISDKDFELASLYIPNVSDTDATARTKLQILSDILVNAQPQESTSYVQTD